MPDTMMSLARAVELTDELATREAHYALEGDAAIGDEMIEALRVLVTLGQTQLTTPELRQWMTDDNLTGIELDTDELTIRTREKEYFMWGPPETLREVTGR